MSNSEIVQIVISHPDPDRPDKIQATVVDKDGNVASGTSSTGELYGVVFWEGTTKKAIEDAIRNLP